MRSARMPCEGPAVGVTCWGTAPNALWSPWWYVQSIRGNEAFHLYIWVLKDLAWGSDYFICGYIFAIGAVLWSAFLLVRAMKARNLPEIWTAVAQLGWLLANTLWMLGELEDNAFPDKPRVYAIRQQQAGVLLIASLCWLSFFRLGLLVVPLSAVAALQPSPESIAAYDESGLEPSKFIFRLGFRRWRELELLHLFFWLGKDTAWNLGLIGMWVAFAIPTVLLALDFCVKTLFLPGMVVEHAHMVAQLLWVGANLTWAAGELFHTDNDVAAPLLRPPTAPVTLRWISVLLLFVAFLPLIALHTHWLLCTYSGLVHVDDSKPGRDAVLLPDYVSVDTTVNPLADIGVTARALETD